MTIEIIGGADTSGETARSSTDALTFQIIDDVMWVWTVLLSIST
jgi:hypothetical protein